jgi:hypothetical protein
MIVLAVLLAAIVVARLAGVAGIVRLLAFKTIEWLEIPHELRWQPYPNAPQQLRCLPTEAGKAALEAAGQFRIVETAEGLRLVAYE